MIDSYTSMLARAIFRPLQELSRSFREMETTTLPMRKLTIVTTLFLLLLAFAAIASLAGTTLSVAATQLSQDVGRIEAYSVLNVGAIVGYGSLSVAGYCGLLMVLHMLCAIRDMFHPSNF